MTTEQQHYRLAVIVTHRDGRQTEIISQDTGTLEECKQGREPMLDAVNRGGNFWFENTTVLNHDISTVSIEIIEA